MQESLCTWVIDHESTGIIKIESALVLWQTEEEQEKAERKIIKNMIIEGFKILKELGPAGGIEMGWEWELYLPSRSRHITDQTKTIN